MLAELSQIKEKASQAKTAASRQVKEVEAQRESAIAYLKGQFDSQLSQAKKWIELIGESVKGQKYHLTYSIHHKWDMPGILEYIASHPDDEWGRLVLKKQQVQTKVTLVRDY